MRPVPPSSTVEPLPLPLPPLAVPRRSPWGVGCGASVMEALGKVWARIEWSVCVRYVDRATMVLFRTVEQSSSGPSTRTLVLCGMAGGRFKPILCQFLPAVDSTLLIRLTVMTAAAGSSTVCRAELRRTHGCAASSSQWTTSAVPRRCTTSRVARRCATALVAHRGLGAAQLWVLQSPAVHTAGLPVADPSVPA